MTEKGATNMARKLVTHTRATACETVARDLRAFGYPDVTGKMVGVILEDWLAGKRDAELPYSIIGMFAGRQFDEIERAAPGFLAKLPETAT
jgi:hypothetical protein